MIQVIFNCNNDGVVRILKCMVLYCRHAFLKWHWLCQSPDKKDCMSLFMIEADSSWRMYIPLLHYALKIMSRAFTFDSERFWCIFGKKLDLRRIKSSECGSKSYPPWRTSIFKPVPFQQSSSITRHPSSRAFIIGVVLHRPHNWLPLKYVLWLAEM